MKLIAALLFALLFATIQPRAALASPAREQVEAQTVYKGIASYYSRSGCLGCSKTLTMANGQPLDDTKLTVAFNKTKLNRKVMIKNIKNGKTVVAKVTDRGGFERLGRIIDLGVATQNAIGCSDLCKVEVTVLSKDK